MRLKPGHDKKDWTSNQRRRYLFQCLHSRCSVNHRMGDCMNDGLLICTIEQFHSGVLPATFKPEGVGVLGVFHLLSCR